MSNDHREEMAGFFLGLIAIALGIAFVLFLVSWFWIPFWFYIFPFIVASLVVGGILKFLTSVWFEEGFKETSSKFYLVYNYKVLAIVFPALAVLVLGAFYFDSKRVEIIERQKGREDTVKIMLEWPRVNKFYNDSKKSWYSDSWYESLRKRAKEPEIYDRQDLGNIAWWALCFGGPLFFFWLSRKDEEVEGTAIKEKVLSHVERERDALNDLIKNQRKYIDSHTAEADKKIAGLRADKVTLLQENLILKAKVEFSTPAAPKIAKVEPEAKGFLDKDIL